MVSFYVMILGFITFFLSLFEFFFISPFDSWLPFSINPFVSVGIFFISFIIGKIEFKKNPRNKRAKLVAKISGIAGLVVLVLIVAGAMWVGYLLSVSMD